MTSKLASLTYSLSVGSVLNLVRRRLLRHDGMLRSSAKIPARAKRSFASYYGCRERAEIALIVGSQFPGGDYFEFGSESFSSFKNFLTAFDLNNLSATMPKTKFFAFDVFGMSPDKTLSDNEAAYFKHYRDLGQQHYADAETRLRNHGLFLDRIELVKGYFEDTLNEGFKARLRAESRRVGFAYLDCNIVQSYKTCFDFLADFILEWRAFIYMDEFFQTDGVAELFEGFCMEVKNRYGLVPRYVRNAGACGALFILMKATP